MKNDDFPDGFDNDYFRSKIGLIYDAEMDIDPMRELYLITWNPDPSTLPNAHFEMQHEYNIDIIANFCKGCEVAIWCVEATQMGNPHYHGFYQVSSNPILERLRIACIKTMQEYAPHGLRITKATTFKRLNYWTPHANCLYYYKKDLLDSMYHIEKNPITKDSKTTVNFNDYAYMFKKPGKRSTSREIIQHVSQRERYRQFYLGNDIFGNAIANGECY